MLDAIALSLPLAVGLVVAAAPIVIVSLILTTTRPALVARAFALGWALGIAVAGSVLVLTADLLDGAGLPDTAAAVLRVLLGIALWWLAVRSWRSRGQKATPSWMSGVETWSAGRALAVGAGLGALNPKNLALVAAGAAAVVEATDVPVEQAVALLAFSIVASAGVATPVILSATGGDAVAGKLAAAQTWMTANASVIGAVVLAVLGSVLLGNGISAL